MVKSPRTFPAPAVLGGGSYTLDELEYMAQEDNSELAQWSLKTYRRERDAILASLSDDTELPFGVAEEDENGIEFVTGLEYEGGVYTSAGWVDSVDSSKRVELDADEVAYCARAFNEGIDMVYIRAEVPAAWIDADTGLAAAGDDMLAGLPAGTRTVAVVDELDRNAVLDLIAVAPGPKVWRRHDGSWQPDATWLHALKSVKPPPLVNVEGTVLASVIPQIDSATAGKPFSQAKDSITSAGASTAEREKMAKSGEAMPDGSYPIASKADLQNAIKAYGRAKDPAATKKHIIKRARALDLLSMVPESWGVTADASVVASITDAADEVAVQFALLAAKNPAKGAAAAERLRQYWLHGKGAAKIRWGTKGSWTRCVHHLSKFLGPRAKGYCQLMHGRATGTWAGRGHNKVPNPEIKAKAIAKQLEK